MYKASAMKPYKLLQGTANLPILCPGPRKILTLWAEPLISAPPVRPKPESSACTSCTGVVSRGHGPTSNFLIYTDKGSAYTQGEPELNF